MLKQQKRLQMSALNVLRSREGASLVLASVIAIIIVTGVVILRVTTGTLLASADKQQNQDQAYMMAVSLGDSIDKLVREDKISDLTVLNNFDDSVNTKYAIPNSSLNVKVSEHIQGIDKYVVVTVRSRVADAEYEYSLTYIQTGSVYKRQY